MLIRGYRRVCSGAGGAMGECPMNSQRGVLNSTIETYIQTYTTTNVNAVSDSARGLFQNSEAGTTAVVQSAHRYMEVRAFLRLR